jgi:STE24 endopeptidase
MWVFVVLLFIQFAISTVLSLLNLRHLRRKAQSPPEEWAERLDTSRFPKMIAYIGENNRLGYVARTANLAITLAILLSGFLAQLTRWAAALPVGRVWQGLIVLAVPAAISYVANLPWELISDFGIEKTYGFSTITVKTWLMDQAKALILSLVLGVLLGGGLLLLIDRLGAWWWLVGWILFSLFQLFMSFIAPVVILPLFNTFEPLEDEDLAQEINRLAEEAHFPMEGVYQIDASRRTTHSNAYFVGFGKTRRIALFDTLLEQLSDSQILAVLAHEIGHWKKKHVILRMVGSVVGSGVGLVLLALLLDIPWLYESLGVGQLYERIGVSGPIVAVGLYLISILLSPVGLLLAPIGNWISRHQEYQADAYALELYGHPEALESGLIELNEKNLSNLFPHPLVVTFRYSHPPLTDRVAAIREKGSQL